jgi:cytochrome c oxidase assembly protein subunit 15
LPFLVFLWRGAIPPPLKARLWIIFGGGAALGVVGWWMVSSGLSGSARVSVSQYRLAFHLTLACIIYAAIVWTARQLSRRPEAASPARFRRTGLLIVALVLLQIYLGALVAGLDAGLSFNTWPLIDGAFVPSAERLWFETPGWRNLFENTLTVQFDHRMVAYALWLVAVAHAFDAWRGSARATRSAIWLAALVSAQAILGIATLLNVAPLGLSLSHQAFAIIVLTASVVHAEGLHGRDGTRTVATAFSVQKGATLT